MKTLDFAAPKPDRRRHFDPLEPMTTVFRLSEGEWRVCWRGQVPMLTFSSRDAAQAYLASCDAAGRLRS